MAQPTPDAPVVTYRETLLQLVPWWLQGFFVLRLLYAIGLVIDAVAEYLVQAVRRRFPGFDSDDSLAIIGRDRRIRRGRLEPSSTYAARLRRWLDDHPRRGGPYALLQQLYAHFASSPYVVDLVYKNGTTYHLALDGTITRTTFAAFSPDAYPNSRGRCWLFFHWPTTPVGDGLWSDPGTWDDGGVWDSNLTAQEVADLRLVPNEWLNGHTIGFIVLLPPGSDPDDYTTAGSMIRIAA